VVRKNPYPDRGPYFPDVVYLAGNFALQTEKIFAF
jgi:hypothetical protein